MIFSAIAFEGDEKTTFDVQAEACLKKMQVRFGDVSMSGLKLISLVYFYSEEDGLSEEERREMLELLGRRHSLEYIPVSYISQPPASGALLSLEVHYVGGVQDWDFNTEVYLGLSYAVLSNKENEKHIIANGITGGAQCDSIQASAEWAFEWMEAVLTKHGMDFGHIFRQWNYIEDIVLEEEDELHKQNYQIFNNVRSRFYAGSDFKNGYPAATGIGMLSGGVSVSFYASDAGSYIFKSLENPFQKAAFEYSHRVLVGNAAYEGFTKCSPKFARAKYVANESAGQVFISGTASIRDENTIGLGNISLQTTTTIENIAHLIREADRLFGSREGAECQTVKFYRVYIKKKRDYALVERLCHAAWPKANFNFVISDVCRDELLVEIEAVSCR